MQSLWSAPIVIQIGRGEVQSGPNLTNKPGTVCPANSLKAIFQWIFPSEKNQIIENNDLNQRPVTVLELLA